MSKDELRSKIINAFSEKEAERVTLQTFDAILKIVNKHVNEEIIRELTYWSKRIDDSDMKAAGRSNRLQERIETLLRSE